MSKIYFTSDTHFSHEKVIGYCERPFKDVSEMNETIIKNWNSVVKSEDTVFHLGDFSFHQKSMKPFINRLNGKVILIKGNHDNHKDSIIEDCVIQHGGKYWHLIHDPFYAQHEFNLVGHVHKLWKVKKIGGKIFVNTGVDVWDFKPVDISDILNAIKDFENHSLQHSEHSQ